MGLYCEGCGNDTFLKTQCGVYCKRCASVLKWKCCWCSKVKSRRHGKAHEGRCLKALQLQQSKHRDPNQLVNVGFVDEDPSKRQKEQVKKTRKKVEPEEDRSPEEALVLMQMGERGDKESVIASVRARLEEKQRAQVQKDGAAPPDDTANDTSKAGSTMNQAWPMWNSFGVGNSVDPPRVKVEQQGGVSNVLEQLAPMFGMMANEIGRLELARQKMEEEIVELREKVNILAGSKATQNGAQNDQQSSSQSGTKRSAETALGGDLKKSAPVASTSSPNVQATA